MSTTKGARCRSLKVSQWRARGRSAFSAQLSRAPLPPKSNQNHHRCLSPAVVGKTLSISNRDRSPMAPLARMRNGDDSTAAGNQPEFRFLSVRDALPAPRVAYSALRSSTNTSWLRIGDIVSSERSFNLALNTLVCTMRRNAPKDYNIRSMSTKTRNA